MQYHIFIVSALAVAIAAQDQLQNGTTRNPQQL